MMKCQLCDDKGLVFATAWGEVFSLSQAEARGLKEGEDGAAEPCPNPDCEAAARIAAEVAESCEEQEDQG